MGVKYMNVLFLTIAGFRSINEPGIYNDLLREFIKNGHQIYVVCAKQKRDNLPVGLFENDGYKILRVGIGNVTKTTNLIEKGISMLGLERKFLNGIKKHYNDVKFDLVLYATPPITFDRVVKYIKKRDLAKSYLLLKDIFPQNAVDLRMFSKRNPIYWYFRLREKQLYRNSDVIGCMSEANVEYLLKHNPELSADIVEVCPNSIEPINIDVNDKQRTDIRQKYGIPLDKTVFIYGGNLGKPQGIEFLIKCLKSNQDNEDVFFLIVGSGTEFNKLKSYFDTEKPNNAKLLDQLPKADYDMLANSCDVGLIFLDNRFTIPNFPSRLLSYMQASMPVLAATDVNTDIGKVIEEGKFGFWCESKDVSVFNDNVNKLCDPILRKEMGSNARRYLEENYTVKHSYEIIMKHFR